ncbi:hypothetical protein NDU88_006762 [Pleurodeles waltl]|uniref:Uncharacterized protein n=1 Tax=Pleurodeles waltl TaxID=8319 RepID=A0AAV7N068_PLEWA|nr:hypothetical protein NDU88_006762 [Pleurodeles waltl]
MTARDFQLPLHRRPPNEQVLDPRGRLHQGRKVGDKAPLDGHALTGRADLELSARSAVWTGLQPAVAFTRLVDDCLSLFTDHVRQSASSGAAAVVP